MTEISEKRLLVVVGQTPPPWHGQAVATQMLFEAPWNSSYDVRTVRMAFSSEMEEVGRVSFSKAIHVFDLWRAIREATVDHEPGILIYPPASPNWVPLLRDLIFLPWVRRHFRTIVYVYHAGGFGEWCSQSLLRKWIARCAYGRADLSLEVAKEETSPHQVLSARSWAWTPYGVKVPPLAPRKKHEEGPTVVLFVGSLQEGKGVLEVIKTASILKTMGKEGEFLFRIVGRWFSGEFEAEARQMHSDLKLEGIVEFPGQLTGDAKWNAYADADIFFFPTHYASEAFPLVLIEALGCGLPVVTTRWRGIPDLFDGCVVARLCAIHAPDEYVEALLAFQSLAKNGVDFVHDARTFYEERYLPDHFLAQVESLVNDASLGTNAFTTGVKSRITGTRNMSPIPCGRHHPQRQLPTLDEPRIGLPTSKAIVSKASPSPTGIPTESVPIQRETSNETSATPTEGAGVRVSAYLADQNPGFDRSFGISRMTYAVLGALKSSGAIQIETISSLTSQQAPEGVGPKRILPWGTRLKIVRLLTDHFHPILSRSGFEPDLHYFPKGYLPLLSSFSSPSVVTIHDTIIQYDEDHYPDWRSSWEYSYWAMMLKHTLRGADRILTVSESSKAQIIAFMSRHRIPLKEVTVTYEPCMYESVPQPEDPAKENYVIHLASCEPHKSTAHLVRWWHDAEMASRPLPTLHLIGTIPKEVAPLLASSRSIVKRPFLEDAALQSAYRGAKALILPSVIEGFGLPALEAYYLGTPVCFVKGTSVEEILSVATAKGGFQLESPESLFEALSEVTDMRPAEVRECGIKLREAYAASKVAERMMKVFVDVKTHC